MSLFVTSEDYKRKPKPAPVVADGTGQFAGKQGDSPGGRSAIELATMRVAKFVPSLVILGYASLCNLVNSKDVTNERDLRLLLFKIAFWLCAALTPFYIGYFDRKNSLLWLNLIVGTLAFPIWAYAFPCGWFVDTHRYDPVIAGFVLIVFSLVTAFARPPKLNGD